MFQTSYQEAKKTGFSGRGNGPMTETKKWKDEASIYQHIAQTATKTNVK